jgi:hypothetical protein
LTGYAQTMAGLMFHNQVTVRLVRGNVAGELPKLLGLEICFPFEKSRRLVGLGSLPGRTEVAGVF